MDINCDPSDRLVIKIPTSRVIATSRWVTVEPLLFLAAMTNSALQVTRLEYLRERIAEDEFNQTGIENSTQCVSKTNGSSDTTEDEIQARLASITLILTAVSTFPALIMTIIAGSLTDRIGRKIGLLTPLVGLTVQAVLYVVIFYFRLPLWMFFISDSMLGVSGGFGLLLATASAYVADISNKKNRTWRIVAAEMSQIFGMGFIQIINGEIIKYLGIGAAFLLSLGNITAAILYVSLPCILPETMDDEHKLTGSLKDSLKGTFIAVYNMVAYNVNGRRWKVAALESCILFYNICSYGKLIVLTYVLTVPFCWNAATVGYFTAVSLLVPVFAVTVAVKVLGYCLPDLWLIQVGSASMFASFIVIANAHTILVMYIGVAVGALANLVFPVIRGALSKLVDEREQGSVFALAGCLDSLALFVGPIMSNAIYSSSVYTFAPLVFYVLGGVVIVPSVIIGILLFVGLHPKEGYERLQNCDEDKKNENFD